jgi:hypothetical protein
VSAPIVGVMGDTIRTEAVRGRGMTPPLVNIEISDGEIASIYLSPLRAMEHIQNVRAALSKIGFAA